MKIGIRLLLAMMACGLLTVIQPASARKADFPRPDRACLHGFLSRSDRAVASAPGHGHRTDSARPRRMNSVASGNSPVFFLNDFAPQPNRRRQADNNQDDGTEANLTASDQCEPPLEWQMTRPDAQHANSFIHAKAKPPP